MTYEYIIAAIVSFVLLSIILKITEVVFDWDEAMGFSVGILFLVGIVAGILYWLCHWGFVLCVIIASVSFFSLSVLFGLFKNDWADAADAIEVTCMIFSIGVIVAVGVLVFIVNEPPEARISAPTKVSVGKNFTFSGADSTDPDGYITSHNWDFGDGCKASGVNVLHAYSSVGTYKIKLTVIDNGGIGGSESSEASFKIDVVKENLTVIKLVVSSSRTWIEVTEPYDIDYAIKQKLLEVENFSVVPEESKFYDFTLVISYKEEEDENAVYWSHSEHGFSRFGIHGTAITCDLKLYDRTDNLLFRKNFYAKTTCENITSYGAGEETLRSDAFHNLQSNEDFIHLGKIIASKVEEEFERE